MKTKNLEEKKVVVIEELERVDGEVDFSKLNDGDKFQLLCRYLNDICSITKSLLQIQADEYVLMEFICQKLGIDVKAKKQEMVKKIKAEMDANIEKSKKELQEAAEAKA